MSSGCRCGGDHRPPNLEIPSCQYVKHQYANLSGHCLAIVICGNQQGRFSLAPTSRSEKLDLRLTPEAKRVLQSAAATVQRSVSEFVLESALSRAAETLPDRQPFGLDAETWTAFQRWMHLRCPSRNLPNYSTPRACSTRTTGHDRRLQN